VKDVCETGDERLESEGGRKSREYEIQGEQGDFILAKGEEGAARGLMCKDGVRSIL